MNKAVFEGLVYDPSGKLLSVDYIGSEAVYILDDDGFLRHIPAADVDRQIWDTLIAPLEGNEDAISAQAAKMLGQEDIFSIAVIRSQLENKEKQFEAVQAAGLPEDARAYLGMVGFRVTVDLHGEVIEIQQPGIVEDDGD
ncbi:MAG: hypothetical protein AAGU04_05870 [Anaerolineaceae bacterium]